MQTPFQVKLPMVEELQIPGIKDAFVLSWKDFFLLKHYKTVINILNQVSDFSILWKKTFSKKSLTASSVFHPGAIYVQSAPPRPPHSPSPCFVPFSVAKSCLTLCDPRDCSMPGFTCPSLSQTRPSLSQTHDRWVSDAIQPSLSLLPPSPHALRLFQHWNLFWWVGSSHQVAKIL